MKYKYSLSLLYVVCLTEDVEFSTNGLNIS